MGTTSIWNSVCPSVTTKIFVRAFCSSPPHVLSFCSCSSSPPFPALRSSPTVGAFCLSPHFVRFVHPPPYPKLQGHRETGLTGHWITGTPGHWDTWANGTPGRWDNGLGWCAHLPQLCSVFLSKRKNIFFAEGSLCFYFLKLRGLNLKHSQANCDQMIVAQNWLGKAIQLLVPSSIINKSIFA